MAPRTSSIRGTRTGSRGRTCGEYEGVDAARLDEFDRWVERSRPPLRRLRLRPLCLAGRGRLPGPRRQRHVAVDATYGNVWYPSRVAADWAPYRDGHWAWVDPWGWTWVDDAPWGFAVSHYGRWTNLRGTWGWVPGPVRSRAYYAPALVAFVGGDNFRLTISGGNVGGIAWFPLGPREVYRPSYPVSRGYFENVNRSNTVVSVTTVNNYYNNVNVTNVIYANQAGAQRDRGRAGDGLRAVAAGVARGGPGHAGHGGPCAGRGCRGRRSDGDQRAQRRQSGPQAASARARKADRRPNRAAREAGRIRRAAGATRAKAGQAARRRRAQAVEAGGRRARTRREGGRAGTKGPADRGPPACGLRAARLPEARAKPARRSTTSGATRQAARHPAQAAEPREQPASPLRPHSLRSSAPSRAAPAPASGAARQARLRRSTASGAARQAALHRQHSLRSSAPKPAAPSRPPSNSAGKPEPRERPICRAAEPLPKSSRQPKADPRGQKPEPSADKPKGKDKDDEEDGKDDRKKKN